MYNNPQKYASTYEMSDDEFKNMVFYYWTSIIYCRSKNDNNKIKVEYLEKNDKYF